MHNSLFMPIETNVVTLRNPFNHSQIQAGLCRTRHQTEHIIFGTTSQREVVDRNANFVVDLRLLNEALDQI